MANDVARLINYVIDINEPLETKHLRGIFQKTDKLANSIKITIKENGKDVSLADATAFFLFKRPVDGNQIRGTGTIDGGSITYKLLDQCYKNSGSFEAIFKIVLGSVERTVLRISGYVEQGGDGIIIDPTGSIPSYDDLANAVKSANDAAVSATSAANSANSAAVSANSAASDANEKATLAHNAAIRANAAAGKIENLSASATTLPSGSDATAEVTEVEGYKHIAIGVPKGDTGETPNIQIGTVTTGEPETSASASITGTAENPLLNLVIPRGKTGAVTGIDYYEGSPAALGAASSGESNEVARGDHVHPMPTAGDIPVENGSAATIKNKLVALETKADAAVRYDVAQSLTDGQKAQARENLGVTQTSVANYTATLTVAGWTGTAAPYTQEANVAGIIASDTPFVDVDMSGLTTTDDMTAAQDAFGLILKATAGAGKITFTASDKPDAALTVKIKVVR